MTIVCVQVLHKFLTVFSKFDWDTQCLSLRGPIPLSTFPNPKRESLLLHSQARDWCCRFLQNFVQVMLHRAMTFSQTSKDQQIYRKKQCNANIQACALSKRFLLLYTALHSQSLPAEDTIHTYSVREQDSLASEACLCLQLCLSLT